MYRNEFKNALIAVSLALSSGPVVFAGTPATVTQENPTNDERRAAYLAHQDALNNIQANRESIIKAIVETWDNEPSIIANVPHWTNEITTALNKASNEQLLKIEKADSYSEVVGILRGDQQLLSVSAANDAIAPVSVGDITSDLVYSPVPPCRIYDTRVVGGAYGNSSRNYQVWGNGATIGGQGGNPAGCSAPQGEPSAISANFTVVPPANSGTGHIKAYPFGSNPPNASFVNFSSGINIANAGNIETAYMAAFDLTVFHTSGSIHSLADVMGYFYPAPADASFSSGYPGALIADGNVHSFGYSVQMTTTTNNQKVFWSAHQPVGTVSVGTVSVAGAGDLNIWPCWKEPSSTSWTTEGAGAFGITMTGIQRNIVSESAAIAPGAGVHEFALCYSTTDPDWTFNDFGYVAAQKH